MRNDHEAQQLPASMNIAELVPALDGGGWKQSVRECLHRVLGIYEIYRIFTSASKLEEAGGKNVFLNVLEELDMHMDFGDLRDRIPSHGSTVIVANHPFGGADTITLSGVCAGKRKDMKVFANAMVSDLPGTSHWLIPLHIMGEDGSTGMNRQAMKSSLEHLRAGGLLVVFPAGAVSRWRNDLGRIADPDWSPHIVRLAMKTDSPVLPVRFFGKNPLWFELLGNIHPMLRSALIVRTFLTMKGDTIRSRAGDLIDLAEWAAGASSEEATQKLKEVVEGIEE